MKRAFRLPWSRRRIDAELATEFQFHLQERVEQFVAAGMPRAEAEAEARRRFGDFDAYRRIAQQIDEETMRQRTFSESIGTIRREVSLAVRVLRRTPSFSFIALTTLALGIGASTAIFTVLDAVVLRPLPYVDSDRLVTIMHPATVPGSGERRWGLSYGGYFQFRDNVKSLSGLGLYSTGGFTVVSDGDAERVRAAGATPSLFNVLRARPAKGRFFIAGDDFPDTTSIVVISHEFWQRRYGGDPAIIGKRLRTSGGGNFEIIGVTEPGLTLPMPGPFASPQSLVGLKVDVWQPLRLNPNGPFYNSHGNVAVGRLATGATIERAQAEVATVMSRFTETLPAAYRPDFMKQYNFRVEVTPLKETVLGAGLPSLLWTVFGSVILVMLIAVANVANLFVVRMDSRRREATVRTALGADRGHLATHYLAESLLLCLTAAGLGLLLSSVSLKALLLIAPANIPRLADVSIGWSSVAFAAALAIVMGVVFGAMPLASRLDLTTLREGGRGLSQSRSQRNLRQGLIVAQMAFALVLLASAGLMIRSFMHLRSVKPGFDPSNTVTFELSVPFAQYDTREKAGTFHREFQRRLAAMPGVQTVGGAQNLPLNGGYGTGCSLVFREGRPYAPGEDTPCVSGSLVAPGFFEALRMNVRGRTPTWADFDQRTQAVVVTQALADRLWPGEEAIGKGIRNSGPDDKSWYRIVGVIPELRAEAMERQPTEAVFYPGTNFYPNRRDGSFNAMVYAVRVKAGDPESIMPAVRRLLKEMSPMSPLMDIQTMDDVVARSMQRTSFIMILLGISAAVALLLSAVGIYGVISYIVTQRRFEIGVRIALGARMGEVATMVLMQSVRLAVIGIALGLAGAWAVTSLLQSLLFGVGAMDPLVLGVVSPGLLAIATGASLAPARRAALIDPIEALRAD
jgi:putative ABC transport system permease protein